MVSHDNLCWNSDNVLCGSAMDGGGGIDGSGARLFTGGAGYGGGDRPLHASENTFGM